LTSRCGKSKWSARRRASAKPHRQLRCARPNTHLNTLQSEEEEEEEEEECLRQDLRGPGLLQSRLFLRHTQRFGTGKRCAGGCKWGAGMVLQLRMTKSFGGKWCGSGSEKRRSNDARHGRLMSV
jgi:hypothetical protein